MVNKTSDVPRLLFADDSGLIYNHPHLRMAGFDGFSFIVPEPAELIPLPDMSKLFYFPGCPPVGYDKRSGKFVTLSHTRIQGKRTRCHAVAAFMEPGFARTLLPAADYRKKDYILPMWGYTAAGFGPDGYLTCGFQVEYNHTWDPKNFDDRTLPSAIRTMMKTFGDNRLARHLANCATLNHCFAAKNFFWTRWEAPLPVSRACNASCLGCLSLQSEESCQASHQRISFRPSVSEVVDLAVHHLQRASSPIVSFGQGCEGEPLTEAGLIAESVAEIRSRTIEGSINLNTNGSLTTGALAIVDAGLDCIRVSMNSARPELYHAYYQPKGYDFDDVVRTISLCVERGVYTMINYLIFPGVTDQEDELRALFNLLQKTQVNFIHFKNLCIDPDVYLKALDVRGNSSAVGIREAAQRIREAFPDIQIGYFNQPGFKVRR